MRNLTRPFLRQFPAALFCALLMASVVASGKDVPLPRQPAIQLKAGGQSIQAEVVASDETRQRGLMFRASMGKNEGMLFVFTERAYHSMWMRNTPLPLSVAFIDDAGKILSIHEMEPFSETNHMAAGPAKYALEMNLGWFVTHKVSVGDRILGLEKAPKPK